ncbi:MAG: tetratricopeptide repeat protein, partial [Flavobacterium sp.]
MIARYIRILAVALLLVHCSEKESSPKTNASWSNDSLLIYLDKANDDKYDVVQKQNFTKQASELLKDQKVDSLLLSNMFKIANRYFNIGDWPNFKSVSEKVLKQSLENKDTLNIARSYSYIGDYYSAIRVSDSSYLFYYKAEKLYSRTSDVNSFARVLLNKALLQFDEDDYLGSEKAVIKALRVVRGKAAKDIEYDSYNLLGIIYNELGEYDRSIDYHNKALSYNDFDEIPSVYQSKATSLNNIGYVYQNLKNYEKAEQYYQEGLKQQNLKYDKPSLYAMLLDNLAYARFRQNKENELPKLFLMSLKLRDSLKLTSGIVANKIHLSEYYSAHNDSVKSQQLAKEALVAARKDKNFRNVLIALKQMGVVQPQYASLYSKEYIHINDS